MKNSAFAIFFIGAFLPVAPRAAAQSRILEPGMHHVRNTGPREWSEFALKAPRAKLEVHFPADINAGENTLQVRQRDVKLNWKVLLNGEPIGALEADEKDLLKYIVVPGGSLHAQNTLLITCDEPIADDIMVGEVTLYDKPVQELLTEAHVSVSIRDEATREHLPARITIVNAMGILQTPAPGAGDKVAARPGYLYTGSGDAHFGVPRGSYTIYATRGLEYGVDSARIDVKPGEKVSLELDLRREVDTRGWISSDTHIHTFTWSKHGDASADDRVLTVAGEGLELPVVTDHNVHVDLEPHARRLNVLKWFTPVIGNEVTTPVGHFNIFPVAPNEEVVNHRADSWNTLKQRLETAGPAKAVILNHARDIHMNVRPFDPERHISAAGMRLDGWEFFPNAMEVINSGSQQTDQYQLMHDWFGMLNHGRNITPVGSSDSHDVSRYVVGQARTYIRVADDAPGDIDVQRAVRNFLEGNVTVSFGLFVEIEVNDSYGPGELVPGSDEALIRIKVSGPSWARAGTVELYANGKKIREAKIEDGSAGGLKWSGEWTLTVPGQDIFLVAVARGPVKPLPFWPVAKPYQPASGHWSPEVFAVSGAVWLDGDRNLNRTAARVYAEDLVQHAGKDLGTLIANLASFDEAVSVQAAALLHRQGKDLAGAEISRVLTKASPATRSAFQTVIAQVKRRRR